MAERIERLAAKVADAGVDWLIVSAPLNLRWLTGFTGSNGVALCPADPGHNPAVLLTDFRYTEQVAAQAPSAWRIAIASNDLQYAINTNWDLFQHGPTKTFYLRRDENWLKATALEGSPDLLNSWLSNQALDGVPKV